MEKDEKRKSRLKKAKKTEIKNKKMTRKMMMTENK